MAYIIQSVQLRRDKMSKGEAFSWIRSHGYKADKVDIGPHFYRFRQVDPARLRDGRFRTIDFGDLGHATIVYL
jgi:hypothetical protein